jgi:hypothetical protein
MFNSPMMKRVATLLAAMHFMLFAQIPLAQAAMIGNSEVIAEQQKQVDRQQLLTMLEDQAVQEKLVSMGVDRDQVEQRINSLTPAELAQFNQQLDQAPAGAGVVGIIVLFLVIFIVTDLRHEHLQLRQLHQPLMRRLALLLAVVLIGACARAPIVPIGSAGLPERVELNDVPFFPQEDYQCGPAALATMLTQRGIDTGPGQLVKRVYLPQRKGSLQVEMVAAARAHDLLVYPLEPRLEAVLTEVAAGNPVLVLQNLAFDHWPQWHFAVVVGYDLTEQTLVLRSGTTRRWTGSFRQFERSWAKGQRWAVVTVAPNQLPRTVQETVWLQAANDLEQTGHDGAALRAYERAVERWGTGLSWFALANARYAQGNKRAAEQALRASVQRDGSFAAGWFNLSHVLAERGCHAQSSAALACAVQLAPDDNRFKTATALMRDDVGGCDAPPACPIR